MYIYVIKNKNEKQELTALRTDKKNDLVFPYVDKK